MVGAQGGESRVVGAPESEVDLGDDDLPVGGPDRVDGIGQQGGGEDGVGPNLDLLVGVPGDEVLPRDPVDEVGPSRSPSPSSVTSGVESVEVGGGMVVGSDSAKGHVLVVGSTMIDLVAYTQRVPEAGETLVGDRFQMGFGGKGANQAVMASLVGAKVTMANAVGDDSYGRMTIENLGSFGIDTGHVHVVPGESGVAPIWVEADGTNRIIVVPGANDSLTAAMAVEAVASFDDLSVVVGQLEVPQTATAAAFGEARRRGVTTVLNPAPAAELDPELLQVTDWLIPNEVEFSILTDGARTDDGALVVYAEQTGTRLLVTLGGDGVAFVAEDGTVSRFPADRVEPVDTTGAGDAFVGAFVAGLATGLDVVSAIRLGTACAGESVTRPGTQTSFPSRERCGELLAACS